MLRTRSVPMCIALVALVISIASPAHATKYWKNSVVTGTWNTGNNWSAVSPAGADNGGVPVLNEAVNIVSTDGTPRTVTYNVNAPSLGLFSVDLTGSVSDASEFKILTNNTFSAKGILIGGYNGATTTAGRAAMTQSAGTASTVAGWDFVLGYGANSTGTYSLSGTGALTANQSEFVGLFGTGAFNHSAGTNTIATATGLFDIGAYAGSSGTYNLSGTGTLTVNTNEFVGDIGTGVFNQTGGTHTFNGTSLYLGYNSAGAGGTYNLSAGTLTAFGADEHIAYRASGMFNQTGGVNTFSGGEFHLGTLAGSTGNYYLSAGSMNGAVEVIGESGTGTFTQTGGDNSTTSDIIIGSAAGSTGTYNLSGTASFSSGRDLFLGLNGTGTFNQSGGTHTIRQSFYLGFSAGSSGTYNLTSGSLDANTFSVYSTRVGYDGTGAFNQSGGTSNFGAGGITLGANTGTGTFNLSGGSATATNMYVNGGSSLTVSGTGVLNVTGTLFLIANSGHPANLSGGTINVGALNFNGFLGTFNWTSGTLHLLNSVTWDSAAYYTSTGAAFGPALALGSNQTLAITGDEGLGDVGAFALTLNGGSAHSVSGTLTVNPAGTITQNAGSTLNASAIVQAGGTVNGTLQNQATFTYQSGSFNGRLLNQGTVSLGPSFTAGNGVENDASMTLALGQTITLNGAGLDNQGEFTLASGTLTGAGPLVNNSLLTGHGTLAGSGGFINNGSVMVSGGAVTLSNSGANTNTGQIDIPGGQQLQLTGASLTNTGVIYFAGGTVGGTATLNNNGGIITGHGTIASPLANAGLLAVDSGILSVNAAFTSSGEIYLAGGVATLSGSGSGTLTNAGILRGDGVVNKPVSNNTAGEIRGENGKRIKLTGVNGSNVGLINLQGGTAEFSQPLVNAAAGQIIGRGTIKVGGTGLQNNGNIALSSGITDVFGDVNNATGSATKGITVSGEAAVTFWDDVTNGVGSLFKVSSGSSATFFGTYGGAGISGTGNAHFESDITPGFSPAAAEFGGNVSLDSTAKLIVELGGTAPGNQFDQVHVAGQLTLGGVLKINLIDLGGGQFAPHANDSFDILDWGTLSGAFNSIELPTLTGTLAWNTSQLYTSGVLNVVSGVSGDYNNNGAVDAADYTVWRNHLGQSFALSNRSTANTGAISVADFTFWKSHFGQHAGAGAGDPRTIAIPEPATVLMLLVGILAMSCRRPAAVL